MKILICGLPGSGKTTFAKRLVSYIPNVVHLNADVVRATINKDLDFSIEDRIEHARRLGATADLLSSQGYVVVVDFVCPTLQTREVFNADVVVWMDTIKEGRFADTNKLFDPPSKFDLRIDTWQAWESDVVCNLRDRILSIGAECKQRRDSAYIPSYGECVLRSRDLAT